MTYDEHYKELHHEYAEASEQFFKVDKEVSQVHGFGNMSEIPRYFAAKKRMDDAHVTYWEFLNGLRGRNINPNDEMGLN